MAVQHLSVLPATAVALTMAVQLLSVFPATAVALKVACSDLVFQQLRWWSKGAWQQLPGLTAALTVAAQQLPGLATVVALTVAVQRLGVRPGPSCAQRGPERGNLRES